MPITYDNSFLIGNKFLGNTFEQDPNPNWIKINGIVLGETSNFGYKTIVNKNIGDLLNLLSTDSKVQAVVYNWSSGTAYVKTEFNLSLISDSAVNTAYTTFIIKSIGTKQATSPIPIPTLTPIPSTVSPSIDNFVTWNENQGQFMLNGSKFVPVGTNAYWLGLMEGQVYPSQEQITEIFKGAKICAFTVIRSHSLGVSTGNNNSLLPSGSTTFNNNAWKTIDWAYSEAKKYGIKLIVPLTDEYNYYHGGYGDFCSTRNVDKSQFWTDSNVRSDFKSYIYNYLNHTNQYTGIQIKNSPELFMIETGNELGQNQVRGNGGTGVPTQEWISDITSYIKSIAPNILVLDGSDESLGWGNNFAVKTTDCFSSHFYWLDKNRINYGASNAKNISKPYIIGECSTNVNSDWYNFVENSVPNIQGTLGWSFYPHDNGNKDGWRVPHDEPNYTQTLYFDNQSSDNTQYLLNISNHCRRMQGISQINSLQF
jgi:mannan endo-1,4-beta-mannosidase